jgi:hypothetical protein
VTAPSGPGYSSAVSIPKNLDVGATLNAVYHQEVIRTGGDVEAGKRVKAKAGPVVQRLSELAPQVRNGDSGALKEAMGLLKTAGLSEDVIFPWLQEHVDVSTIKSAGLDPQAVLEKFEAFQDTNQSKDKDEAPEGPSQPAGTMDYPKRV